MVCSYRTAFVSLFLLGSFINGLRASETFILISLDTNEISK